MRAHLDGSFQLRRSMTLGRLGLLAAAVVAASVVAACSSSSGGGALTNDNDAASGDDMSTDAGGTASKDSGQSPPKGDAAVTCGARVNSGVVFDDAGAIYCAANMPCDLASDTCCVSGLGVGTCKTGHNGCGGGTGLSAQAAFQCVEDTDCPTNQVCCGYVDSTMNTAGSKCQAIGADNKCPAPMANTQSAIQFCQKTCECKDGSECVPQSCPLGVPGVPNANLTMCGLQADAGSFHCVAR
jgi:hypothetical protein